MAIEIKIAVGINMSSRDLANAIADFMDVKANEGRKCSELEGPGFVAYVSDESSLGKELMSERFGINSTVVIVLRYDKVSSYEEFSKAFIQVCLFLLSYECDVVALENRETTVLLRRSGKVLIDNSEPYWLERFRVAFAEGKVEAVEETLARM